MSTNVSSFLFRLFLKAGAKLKILFVSCKKKLKKFETFFFVSFSSFSLSVSQGTFRVLRGANVISVFHSHKLFLIFFENFFSAWISFSCQSFRERLSLLRVQKYHLYLHLQDFFLYFFHVFNYFFLNRLITSRLHLKLF